MDIVDAQLHLFHKMDADACLFAMDSLGIQSVLIDEIWPGETTGASQPFITLENGIMRPIAALGRVAAMQHPSRFKYLQRIHPLDPQLETLVQLADEDPHCVAFRVEAWPHHRDLFASGQYLRFFQAVGTVDMPVCVLNLNGAELLEPYIEQVPDCRFIVDQLGIPRNEEAFDFVLRLARFPHVSIKYCHPYYFFEPGDFPYRGLQRRLRQMVDAFGQERVMWASDITVTMPGITWADTLFSVRENELLTMEERSWVLGRAARKALQWPAEANGAA